MTTTRLAVLIDGDNFQPDLAGLLFEEVVRLGVAAISRVYGNASSIHGWREKAREHGVTLRELAPGKNAADMAIAIDAMEILLQGKVNGFCLVSSDGDFAVLADRLREDRVAVWGFGESKAAVGFRQACDGFKVLKQRATPPKTAPQIKGNTNAAKPATVKKPQQEAVPVEPNDAKILKQRIIALAKGRSSLSLSELGKHLGKAKTGEGGLKKRLLRLGLSVDAKDMVAVPLHLVA